MQDAFGTIRIAYVVHSFQAGGLERCAALLADGLDRNRYQPSIVCLSTSGTAAEWLTAADVPIIELNKQHGNDPRVIGRLMRVLREREIDIAQSHNWGTLLETSIACRAVGAVHIHAEHGQELSAMGLRGPKRLLHRALRRWAFRRCAATIACAESVRQRLHREWGFPKEQIHFLPNGIEAPVSTSVEARSGLRRQLGIPLTSVVIGSVGRLAAVKDFPTAIEAVAELCKRGVDIHLVIVGDGAERESLQRAASQPVLSGRVHLVGRQQNVGDWLAAFDLYINSSLSEAMSLSILEAMAVGLPIVATDVGDTGRMIAGNPPCGVVVPPGAPSVLADAIESIVDAESRRNSLGRNGRRRYLREYAVKTMLRRYTELYGHVARHHRTVAALPLPAGTTDN